MIDDALELCGNPSTCPSSCTATRNCSFAGRRVFELKAIEPWNPNRFGSCARAIQREQDLAEQLRVGTVAHLALGAEN